MEKMEFKSKDIVSDNVEKISNLFPNVVSEGKIDFEKLRQELTNDLIEGEESYDFTWVGKKNSVIEANIPTTKTLRPCVNESVNFDTTENLYIEGDNLEVLKILQKSYFGNIKCIYIDPPYNTGNDFIYNDDFKMDSDEYKDKSGEIDDEGNRLFKNTDSNGRFHSDWCSMIYSRLKLAYNLLSDDGVIFISIDDNEIDNLKKICDEVFGEDNFIANFIRTTRKGGGSMSKYVSTDNDYCILFAKNIKKLSRFFVDYDENYLKRYSESDSKGRYFWDTFARNRQGSSNNYTIEAPDGTEINGAWIYQKDKFKDLYEKGDIQIKMTSHGWSVQCKQRLNEAGQIMRSQINDFTNEMGTKEIVELLGRDIFTYAKPYQLIKFLVKSICRNYNNSIILDFFSGSATTAHAVMKLNAEDGGHRKFIMVQLPEETSEDSEAYKAGFKNICEIGKERIRRAGKKIIEENKDKESIKNLDIGFRVLKLSDSNMKNVYYNPDDYSQDLISQLASNIKDDRNEDDLLFAS